MWRSSVMQCGRDKKLSAPSFSACRCAIAVRHRGAPLRCAIAVRFMGFICCMRALLMTQVPYVLVVAYPDHKRPRATTETGHVEGDVRTALLKVIASSLKWRELDKCKSFSDLHQTVYKDCYMEQDPYEMHYHENGVWTRFTFDFSELVAVMRKRRRML